MPDPAPAPPTGRRETAVLCRGLDTYGGTGFVRERLALLGKVVFLLSFGFYVALFSSVVFVGGAPVGMVLGARAGIAHLAASSVMGLMWVLARRPSRSLGWIGAIDAFGLILGTTLLAGMAFDPEQIMPTLLAITVTVMARAILVPSTPHRTLLLSALAFAPTIAVCIAHHHPTQGLEGFSPAFLKFHLTLNTVLWAVLGTALSTVTSQVTYGLRQQVAEASDIGQYTLEEKIGGGEAHPPPGAGLHARRP
jgi:eukaryotic-like serine/threonine-protein kinase